VNNHIFNVDQEVVIITGVNGQLGSVYSRGFLNSGAKVVGVDLISTDLSINLKQEFPERYEFFEGSVTSKRDLEKALEFIQTSFGEPTVLINNAAIDSPPNSHTIENGPFETYPDESFDKVMDVNVKGVYLACKVFGGAMAKAGNGSIINVSSTYGVVSPDQSIYEYRRKKGEEFFKPVAYSVSKSALLNLTRYLGTYWGRKGVRVNTLVIAGVENNQDAEFKKEYEARIPIGRMANEDEYLGSVLFLASQASKYMTGSQLVIDGGWTAI
jgi:NAD(P)-dependent dehydrogenase (short-subunit alcohol dehydrogenase family)